MDMSKLDELINKRMATFMLVFGEFILTPLILCGVAWYIIGESDSKFTASNTLQPVAMGLTALASALLLLGDNAGNLARRAAKGARPGVSAEEAFVSKQFVGYLVTFACLEAAAILGFVSTFLTKEIVWCAVLSVLSVLAMLRELPSVNKMRKAAQQSEMGGEQ